MNTLDDLKKYHEQLCDIELEEDRQHLMGRMVRCVNSNPEVLGILCLRVWGAPEIDIPEEGEDD